MILENEVGFRFDISILREQGILSLHPEIEEMSSRRPIRVRLAFLATSTDTAVAQRALDRPPHPDSVFQDKHTSDHDHLGDRTFCMEERLSSVVANACLGHP